LVAVYERECGAIFCAPSRKLGRNLGRRQTRCAAVGPDGQRRGPKRRLFAIDYVAKEFSGVRWLTSWGAKGGETRPAAAAREPGATCNFDASGMPERSYRKDRAIIRAASERLSRESSKRARGARVWMFVSFSVRRLWRTCATTRQRKFYRGWRSRGPARWGSEDSALQKAGLLCIEESEDPADR